MKSVTRLKIKNATSAVRTPKTVISIIFSITLVYACFIKKPTLHSWKMAAGWALNLKNVIILCANLILNIVHILVELVNHLGLCQEFLT